MNKIIKLGLIGLGAGVLITGCGNKETKEVKTEVVKTIVKKKTIETKTEYEKNALIKIEVLDVKDFKVLKSTVKKYIENSDNLFIEGSIDFTKNLTLPEKGWKIDERFSFYVGNKSVKDNQQDLSKSFMTTLPVFLMQDKDGKPFVMFNNVDYIKGSIQTVPNKLTIKEILSILDKEFSLLENQDKVLNEIKITEVEYEGTMEDVAKKFQQRTLLSGWSIVKKSEFKNKIVYKLCKKPFAYKVLNKDKQVPMASIMPCPVSITKKPNGKIGISTYDYNWVDKVISSEYVSDVVIKPTAKDIAKILDFSQEIKSNLYISCASCHGKFGEIKATNETRKINELSSKEILTSLTKYKTDKKFGKSQKAIMQGMVGNLSKKQIKQLSIYVGTLKDK